MPRLALTAAAAACIALPGAAQVPPPPGPGSWVLQWSDDFDGPTLNTSNWNVAVNKTQDAGHSIFIPEAISVANSNLVITATYQQYPDGNTTRNFTSGWVDSRNHFYQRGGRWEVRAKLPPTAATCSWPAFWLLPNPDAMCWPIGGEVDIMEYVSGFQYQHKDPKLPSAIDYGMHFGYQCYQDASGYGVGGTYPNMSDTTAPIIDYSADYHVFGAVLNDTAVTFYVDDTVAFVLAPPPQTDPSFTWGKTPYVPFTDMYAIINYSIAPYGCTQPPPPDAWAQPQQLLVDWVRVYKWDTTA